MKIMQRVRHPSPPTSGDINMGAGTTRNDSAREGDHADIRPKGAELTHPAVLDIKQEADLNVEPFVFKPLQLADLVVHKSLENLENLGGVEGLLRGIGTSPLRGLSTKLTPPNQLGSPDPGTINVVTPYGVEMMPIMITRGGDMPKEPQCTARATREGSSGVGRPACLDYSAGAYEATIEDRQRIYGQNILPQRPSKSLRRLMWLALQEKVVVRPTIPHSSLC